MCAWARSAELPTAAAASAVDDCDWLGGAAPCAGQTCYDLDGVADSSFFCVCFRVGIMGVQSVAPAPCTRDECPECTTFQTLASPAATLPDVPAETVPAAVKKSNCRHRCAVDAACTGYAWECTSPGCQASTTTESGVCNLYTAALQAADITSTGADHITSIKKPTGGACSKDTNGVSVCPMPRHECFDPGGTYLPFDVTITALVSP
eukprot:TRINITY_DN4430_c0_g6_i1.p1 TRINITY_DN4430_c0_g6~~TRINITY_DN4430_c0_g6_i1.p1  ORF type:complete len:207 (+),score=26.19 TRINITY_DN4430_c0_g6_i1:291-911(+)